MAKKLTLKELENLSRLLLSDVEHNLLLGFELLKNHPKAVPSLCRELVLINKLHPSMEQQATAYEFLKKHYNKTKLQQWENAFVVFRRIRLYYSFKPPVRKMLLDHENIRGQFQDLISRNKHYSLQYYHIAKRLHRTFDERLDLAETYYRIALENNADNQDVIFYLAYLLDKREGNVEEAITLYEKLITLNPKESAAYNNLGLLYDHKGVYKKAYGYYKKALQLSPNSDLYTRNLAILCANSLPDSYNDEAKTLLKKLIKSNPSNSMVWNSWADYLWNVESKHKKAEDAYKQGLQVDPNNAVLIGNLGELYIDIYDKIEEGLDLYRKSIKIKKSPYRLTTLITTLAKCQEIGEAKKYYRLLLQKFAPKKIQRAKYLRDDQWEAFLEAQKKLIG